MLKLIAALFVTLFLGTAGTVYAGDRPGAFTLCPFVGGYTFDGAEKLETRPMFGLRVGYDITKNFGMEGIFGYVSTRFTNLVPGTVNVYNYRLGGVYNLVTDRTLEPYLGISVGGTTLEMPINDVIVHPHNHSPTLSAGGGIKWFFCKNVAIRAEYHQNILFYTNDANNKTENFLANYVYSLGLHILFGGT
jgi:OOP family OmpA-OmpF porin